MTRTLRRPDLRAFDPAAAGDAAAGVFGLPFEAEESSVLLVPAPWEPTTSYGKGTAAGPSLIRHASAQLDLLDPDLEELGLGAPWKHGIHMLDPDPDHVAWNEAASAAAAIATNEQATAASRRSARAQVNDLGRKFHASMEARASALLDSERRLGVVGGDHSVPLGVLRALGARRGEFGILHVDAHADLRLAYEGFEASHASIMYNVLEQVPSVSALVQVGIRDLSAEELERARTSARVHLHLEGATRRRMFAGATWQRCVEEMLAPLPREVYISFDIDGLDPALCPGTGTPVPGGLSFAEAMDLIWQVVRSGREVVGFDLCEVASTGDGEWDGNVGARVLYRLCGALLHGAGARDV